MSHPNLAPNQTTADATRVLAAEWILPVTTPPIRDGALVLEGARIAWVGPRRDLPSRYLEAPVRGFPRSLLLPGWVNAHCHLNLTAALGLMPGTADRFTDWARQVIRFQSSLPPHIVRQSIVAGMDLLLSTGTTTVAHVSTLPPLEPFLEHLMRSVVFHEPIAFRSDRAEDALEEAEEWLENARALVDDAGAAQVQLGIAPHAPYSVSPGLLRGVVELAERERLPLSVHLAETRAEAELIRDGSGQFRELLEELDAWDPTWTPPGVSPVQYVAELGVLGTRGRGQSPPASSDAKPADARSAGPGGLAVHCNYLSDQDIQLLVEGGLTPVWCPGSHLFFGHRQHPAPRLLDAGVRLALGTDSLASNAGLNMLREARLAAGAFPEVNRAAWLRAGTLAGAEALGLDTGSLEPGKAADIQVLQGVPEEVTDPLAALFEADLRVRMVLVRGVEAKIR